MSGYCLDCGSKMDAGICSNCKEELYVLTFQSDDLPEQVSDEFARKAEEQRKELQRSKANE